MTKHIDCKEGETVEIYRRRFSSVPTKICFEAIAVDGQQPKGEVEIRGSNWIFPKSPSRQPLQAMNVVSVGFWDTFLAIAVTAHTDLSITLPLRQFKDYRGWLWALVAVTISVAVGVFLLS